MSKNYNQLDALGAAHATDKLPIMDNSGTPQTKAITVQSFLASMDGDGRIAGGLYVGSMATDPPSDALIVDDKIGINTGISPGTTPYGRLQSIAGASSVDKGIFLGAHTDTWDNYSRSYRMIPFGTSISVDTFSTVATVSISQDTNVGILEVLLCGKDQNSSFLRAHKADYVISRTGGAATIVSTSSIFTSTQIQVVASGITILVQIKSSTAGQYFAVNGVLRLTAWDASKFTITIV